MIANLLGLQIMIIGKLELRVISRKKEYNLTQNYEVKKYFCWSQLKNYLLNSEHFLVLRESELT
jgi:hypothetical protein